MCFFPFLGGNFESRPFSQRPIRQSLGFKGQSVKPSLCHEIYLVYLFHVTSSPNILQAVRVKLRPGDFNMNFKGSLTGGQDFCCQNMHAWTHSRQIWGYLLINPPWKEKWTVRPYFHQIFWGDLHLYWRCYRSSSRDLENWDRVPMEFFPDSIFC